MKGRFLIFDGHAIVHRAYHAFERSTERLSTKNGEVVSAVYGFAQMLLKALNEYRPTHYAIAFDLPTPTFRHLAYDQYKAQRPPAPDELRQQFGRVRQLVEAFRIPVFEMEGYEADDVIGTLARQAGEKGLETIIVTGDADAMQLVSPSVRVLYPRPRGSFGDAAVFDEAAVEVKYHLPPSRLADFKALAGDTSDNIPGVSGVGEKTALRLIQQFGSVDGTYERLDEVAPLKLQETLRKGRDLAFKSKELATIVATLPVELDLDACSVKAYDRTRVAELFRELEFVRLLSMLPQVVGPEPRPAELKKPQGEYRVINTLPTLEELATRLEGAETLAVDVETTGKEEREAELVGMSLSWRPGEAYYIPVGHHLLGQPEQLPIPLVAEKLCPALTATGLPKVAHNGKYDMTVLGKYGVEVKPLAFDTMVAAWLLGERAINLKALAFSRLGVEMTPITALIGSGAKQISMAQVPVEQVAPYACADADLTLQLKAVLEEQLKKEGLDRLFYDVEMPLVPLLLRMEQAGVALDLNLMREIKQAMDLEVLRLEKEIYQAVGHTFNINSTQQLGQVLFEELKLPRSRRTKTGYSTEAAVLEELKGVHAVVPLLLEYRQLVKLKSTYVDALPGLVSPETGRLHTSYNQTGTVTGRLSSSEPNLQNIPVRGEWGKRIRQAIIAGDGRLLLSADYSQIDLRVLAHLSQDPSLVGAFSRDEDIHAATAAQVFGVGLKEITPDMRRVAKTVNFGVIYGMSEYGLEQATELSREEAAKFIVAYFEKYPGVKAYLEETKEKARNLGYVETVLGRRRYIPEINSPNRMLRESAERMAINMPVQGTSADIIKLAMLSIQEDMDRRGLKSLMTLQVHDELVFDVYPGEMEQVKGIVREVMPRALELSVPLRVDLKVGRNWGEMG
jgi:DNA polymerase-1